MKNHDRRNVGNHGLRAATRLAAVLAVGYLAAPCIAYAQAPNSDAPPVAGDTAKTVPSDHSAAPNNTAAQPGPAEPAPDPSAIPPTPDSSDRPLPPPPPRHAGQQPGAPPGPPPQGSYPQGQYTQGYPGPYPEYPGYGHMGYGPHAMERMNEPVGGRIPGTNHVFRPFTLSFGAGPGGLSKNDSHTQEAGFSYSFRLAFGFAPSWNLYLSWEGATASGGKSQYPDSSQINQEAFLVGLQYFVLPRLHVRAGAGFANVSEDTYVDDRGVAFGGAVGYDLLQGYNFSIAAELGASFARYPGDVWWTMGGANLVLSFF